MRIKHKFKRYLAGLLAIVTLVTSMVGYVPVYAASETSTIGLWYASARPHAAVNEFNSSHTGHIFYTKVDNQVGYCMNFGLEAHSGRLYNSSDQTMLTTLSDKQDKLLAYCLYYGHSKDNISTGPSNAESNEYIATQAVVWIIMYDIFGTSGADSAAYTLCQSAPDPSASYEYYKSLRDKISTAYNQTIPSFASKRKSSAETYELKWNETNQRFEITLNDQNGILSEFDFAISGYNVEKDGNNLTISKATVDTTVTEGSFTSNNGKVEATSSVVFWVCGDASQQEFASDRPQVDPLYAYIKVKTEEIGYGYLIKVDSETGSKLPNATYGIYSDSGCSKLVDTLVTGTDGTAKSKELVAGTYYVREIKAPQGYVLSPDIHTVVVKAGQTTEFTEKDTEQRGAVTIYKEGEVLTGWNGTNFVYELKRLPGATFKVTAGADIIRSDGTKVYNRGDIVREGLVTGSDGSVVLNNLYLGTYVVTETKSIDGYTINNTPMTVTITYKDPTATVQYESATIKNNRQKAEVNVIKTDGTTSNPLKGGEYTLYAGNDIKNYAGTTIMSRGTKIQTVTTGSDGNAKYTVDIPVGNSYYINETKAPYGYVRNSSDTFNFSFTPLSQSEAKAYFKHTFKNECVTAKIHLYKIDKETGKAVPQGDARLEGAKYGLYAREDIVHPDGTTGVIYKKDSLIAELTTDKNAEAEIKGLYLGKYYIKEIEPPVGYNLDTEEHDVECSYEGDKVTEVSRTTTSKETVIKQPFQLIKVSEDGSETEAEVLKGAGFTAYLKSTLIKDSEGHYDFTQGIPVVIGENGATTIYTDEKGYAKTIPIPYGTYIVVESVTPHNMDTIKPFEVVISKNSPNEPQVWRIFLDREFSAKLRIVKKDAETGKTILLPDTEFQIYNKDTGKYVEIITTYPSKVVHKTFVTDEDGDLILPETLPIGNYRIEELHAPDGYIRNSNFADVTIDSDTFHEVDPDTFEAIITVDYKNESAKGELTVEKKGEVLDDYEGGWFADSEEKSFTYRMGSLAGAEFEVRAAEDIYTPDYQLDKNGNRIKIYAKGDLVTKLTTNETGKAKVGNLPLGAYNVKEIKAPYGYLLSPQEQTVFFSYVDEDTPVVYESRVFSDEREKVEIQVEKRDAEDDRAIEGAVFGLYAAENIKNVDGTTIVDKGDLIEQATSDKDGVVIFLKDIPFAQYEVKELAAPDGYVSSDEILSYETKYVAQDIPVAKYSSVFLNTPTTFEFSKEDITSGAELDGATLSVLNEDGEVVETWTSKAKEKHVIKRLVVGKTYTLREEFAPYGYLRATDVTFTVLDEETVQSVVMRDEVPTGSIVINKDGEFLADVTLVKGKWYDAIFNYFRDPVDGVEFELYAAEDIVSYDGLGTVYFQKDELVDTLITNEKGVAAKGNLPIGKYYLIETKTKEGFIRDTERKEADLSYINQETKVIYAGMQITNNRQKVKISILKTDAEDGVKLEGAIFGIFAKENIIGKDEKVVFEKDCELERAVTDSEGSIIFTADLPLGEYYVKELQAPKGYASTDVIYDISATYQGDDIEFIEFSYEFKNSPITVEFSKTDITGDIELEGAKLIIIDADGKTVESWTSTKDIHTVKRLAVGKYILREETSPYGYKIANDIEFEILDSGDIQKVEMRDEYVFGKIKIKKRDAELSQILLDGVTFEIKDAEGNVLDTITTDQIGEALSKELPICTYIDGVYDKDIVYTVVEVKTKEGYIIDCTPHEVVLKYSDTAPDIIEYTLELTNKSEVPKVPKTGDDFNPVIWILIGTTALLFAVMAFIFHIKKEDEDQLPD